jgi:hypothetical protein
MIDVLHADMMRASGCIFPNAYREEGRQQVARPGAGLSISAANLGNAAPVIMIKKPEGNIGVPDRTRTCDPRFRKR